jgi:hypothetical protein
MASTVHPRRHLGIGLGKKLFCGIEAKFIRLVLFAKSTGFILLAWRWGWGFSSLDAPA